MLVDMNLNLPPNTMKDLGVAGVYLFGSHAQGTASPTSDVDIGIILSDPRVLADTLSKNRIYNEIYDSIAPQLGKPMNIDIVFLQLADNQLCFHVVRDGKLLYFDNAKEVSDFVSRTIDAYLDFAPHRAEFHRAILARV